jgi:hypothetical protein
MEVDLLMNLSGLSCRLIGLMVFLMAAHASAVSRPCVRDANPLMGSERARLLKEATTSYHGHGEATSRTTRTRSRDEVGIKEIVPQAIRDRYRKWKAELLSTDFGRKQWDHYANNKEFLLTIVVSEKRKYGAGTDDFEWNDAGELVAATITLGKNLDKGYPDPVYYPVMNSLATYDGFYEISGDILASTKFIHELGHVNFTAKANAKVFQKQDKLIASYNAIFLKNGYNTSDPRLVALASELGGMPIEIWEAREYQSEVSAFRFLMERMNHEPYYCSVFSRAQRNITSFARNYKDSFEQVVGELPRNVCTN